MGAWIRRHRALAAFATGVLLTLGALAVVGYLVLSDQRRSARLLSAALSRALAREVRIERVTDLGPEHVVLRGVQLPEAGGWPADITADRVEATGPLLASVRGDETPIRVVVTQATVTGGGGGPGGLAALDGLRERLRSLLASAPLLDLTLTAGVFRDPQGGQVAFDLTLRKGRGDAKGELTVHGPAGPPLVLTADAWLDGQTARLGVVGRGGLAAIAGWLPADAAAALTGPVLDLRVDADLAPLDALSARVRVSLGSAAEAAGEMSVSAGLVQIVQGRLSLDLGLAAALAAVPWRPTGRVELGEVTLTWKPEGGAPPTVAASLSVPAVTLPAAAAGIEVGAERLAGRLTVEPSDEGFSLRAELQAARLRAAGEEVAPITARVRARLDPRGRLARAELDALSGAIAGAPLRGDLTYDAIRTRVDGQLSSEGIEAAPLLRRLGSRWLHGWLDDADRLRVTGLEIRLTDLDPAGLAAGSVALETRGLALQRTDGELTLGRTEVRATLHDTGVALAVDATGLAGTLTVFHGTLPAIALLVDLARASPADGGGLTLREATVTARDGEGHELAEAELGPADRADRMRLRARLPALERLDGLWPDIQRRLTGSATLDAELSGPGLRAVDGRLAIEVPAGELLGGKASLRGVVADLPVRRGSEGVDAPGWGRLDVAELIGYGVVLHDLTTPARVWNDRLALNDLAYALYAGEGKGWAEVELEPAGPYVRGNVTGAGVRVEEFIGAYGIRGGTMTGLLRYDVKAQYRSGRLAVDGRFEIPEGGTVSIELLERLLRYAEADPTGVVRQAIQNLRAFEYKSAEATAASTGNNIVVNLQLKGRERFLIFPPAVREINVVGMPLSFLGRQFPGY